MSKENPATREQQAHKIVSLLREITSYGNSRNNNLCLDIGCGSGEISYYLASEFNSLVGIDVELNRLKAGYPQNHPDKTPFFAIADGTFLPFPNSSVDIVICAQVYEHTINQKGLFDEIWRVLKPDGICFFSGPNKYTILEEHYFLPFLSWLPSSLANFYMQVFSKGKVYDVFPLSRSGLLSLMEEFCVIDLSLKLIKKPSQYGMTDRFGILKVMRHLPETLLLPLLLFIPNFNFILRKPSLPDQ